MWGDTTATVSSVTDSKGNTYALAAGPTKATGLTSALYYAKNIAAGTNTVTVKFSATAHSPNVNVLEYSGLDTANPLDAMASATVRHDGEQRVSYNDVGERSDRGCRQSEHGVFRRRRGVQQPDDQCLRRNFGRQDCQQYGKLQRDCDDVVRDLGHADGRVPRRRTRNNATAVAHGDFDRPSFRLHRRRDGGGD